MWSALIVIDPPRLDLRLRVGHRRELMHVQTFVPRPAVKRFNERIFDRLAGRMKFVRRQTPGAHARAKWAGSENGCCVI